MYHLWDLDQAVKLLAIRFGESPPKSAAGLDLDEVPNIITVQSIANAVMDILRLFRNNVLPAANRPGRPTVIHVSNAAPVADPEVIPTVTI
jgi:hypothetical protein